MLSNTATETAMRSAQQTIGHLSESLVQLSHTLHSAPEVGFEEVRACGWLTGYLADHGFVVESGLWQLATSFVATAGDGPLVIAFCAEYDALPGIGHACGHNVIATAAVAAGIALASVADDLGITVRVYGTPAEENGGGKVLMLERGAFDGVHAAMMVHPSPTDRLDPPALARAQLHVRFDGKAAHASVCPEDGINAADAMTVAQAAIGLLRQHIAVDQRIHGIVTTGGQAPDIVPARTEADYYIRGGTLAAAIQLDARVRRCFEAGALATGATVDITSQSPAYSEFRHDTDLLAAYERCALRVGRVFPATTAADDRQAASTDMANVSLALPAIQPLIGIESGATGLHQAEFAEYAARPAADRAALDGGLAMAWSAVEVACQPDVRTRLLNRDGG